MGPRGYKKGWISSDLLTQMPVSSRPRRPRRLRPSEVSWSCPANWVPGPRSAKPEAAQQGLLFGQERALDSMRLGLAMGGAGFHVFVAGVGGSDRVAKVVELIEKLRLECPLPTDHIFVHNFSDSTRPTHIYLPAGRAPVLAEAMDRWTRTLSREIRQLLDSGTHVERRHALFKRYRQAEERIFRRLARLLQGKGLELVRIEDENGPRRDILSRIGEQLVPVSALSELPKQARPSAKRIAELRRSHEKGQLELRKTQRKARSLGLRLLRESQAMDEGVVQELVENLTLAVAEEVGADEELASWLGDCAQYANTFPQLFLRQERNDDDSEEEEPSRSPLGLEVFEVNIVRSSGASPACPVVSEQHPSYSNLFGTVERHVLQRGSGHTHLAVRPGALLAADGGFLVLNARDVFREAEVWRALKRTLQTGQLAVHALDALSPLGVSGVRPRPVPLDIKIVLVGDHSLYEQLHSQDYDFSELFKVLAEFEDSVPLTRENVGRLVRTLRQDLEQEGVLALDRSGMQALVERAVGQAGRRNRLSTDLASLTDFAREAGFLAEQDGARRIHRAEVEQARQAFRRMHSSEAEWQLRQVLEGIYQIESDGTLIGSVNALVVVSVGPLSFGRPARVSAVVSAGEESYLNVERDVDLSGPIHNKGVLMLESFMRHRFGQERALPTKVSLAFDQSYGPIDGDSASSTEVYALLSALCALPVRQDVAVTGAVSMKGEVLAVGGVDAKVRGFWELCRARGLTGEQGVMLPEANVDDLMLEPELLADVRAGRFHLWAVGHVDQGIALLTGCSAAEVHKRVVAALSAYEQKQKDDGPKERD